MKDENKFLFINLITTLIAFIINAGISFLLSKYIVNTVSEEAYGFIQLANSFVMYFTIITVALNSMASRFISISYFKKNIDDACEYYSSVFYANIILIIIFLPILIIAILNIDKFMHISPNLILDVKILFTFLALNLLLGMLSTNLSVCYYIKNKLYINSVLNAVGYVIKAILLVLLYVMFPPYITIFGIITFIITLIIQICNIYYTKKLIPEIKLSILKVKLIKIKEVLFSGIWNSIIRIGSVMSEGLDLLLSNLFLGSEQMGILAIVKTIPNMIANALTTLVNVFLPQMTKLYAEGKKEELVKYIKKSMKIVGIFLNLPIACIVVFGNNLFELWFPTQNSLVLQVLTIVTISQWIIIGPVYIMHNIFTILNKVKVNSILILITGVLNVIIVYILLKFTDFGLLAITSVSCILSILRNLLYTLPYSAKYFKLKWNSFLPVMLMSILSLAIIIGLGYGLKTIFTPNSWLELIIGVIILCVISLIVDFFVVLKKEEKNIILDKFINLIKKIFKINSFKTIV